jgi:hypothetical protein
MAMKPMRVKRGTARARRREVWASVRIELHFGWPRWNPTFADFTAALQRGASPAIP